MGQTIPHPPNRHITQLKNLILAEEFSVKVEKEVGAQRTLLALKRPMVDINAEEAGEIHYWEPLGALLGGSWGLLESSWVVLEAIQNSIKISCSKGPTSSDFKAEKGAPGES